MWSQYRSRGQVFLLRVKGVETCGCRHTSNTEISHGCVKTRKTSMSSHHVCCRFADAIKCLCHRSTGCLPVNLHLIENSEQQDACLSRLLRAHLYTFTEEHTEESRRSKARAKDDESRSVTFQCVMTRHAPRYLPLHPSRIGAASLTRVLSVSLVRGNQEHRPHWSLSVEGQSCHRDSINVSSGIGVLCVEAALTSTSPALAKTSLASARDSSASLRSHFNCIKAP